MMKVKELKMGEIILDYPGEPNLITNPLKQPFVAAEKTEMAVQEGFNLSLQALKLEE